MNNHFKTQSLTVNQMNLSAKYWHCGTQKPVLALHGWLDNASSFNELAPLLNEHPIYALDFAGHGLSDHRPPGVAYYMADHVRDVINVADQLELDKFTLLGHSMGANVAVLLAGAFPNRVEKLILIEGFGPPSSEESQSPSSMHKGIVELAKVSPDRMPVYSSVEMAIEARMQGFLKVSRSASTHLCERGLKPVDGGYTWRTDPRLRATSLTRFSEPQVLSFIKNIQAPTYLILAQDSIIQRESFFKTQENRLKTHKHLTVDTLPGNHHLHLEEQAQLVANAIKKFL